MGIVNVTPDSFSDGGKYFDQGAAIEHGLELAEQGADIVDVGGESTRPFAELVSEKEEIRRVVGVIEELSKVVRVSIDTRHARVARLGVEAGATLINDVSSKLWEVAAEMEVGWVAMHMQGDPADMQINPRYQDVFSEVARYLTGRAQIASRAGIGEIYVDPGIGFGKTAVHNLAILKRIGELKELTGVDVLVGVSRKRFLSLLSQAERESPPPTTDRLEQGLACACYCYLAGVKMMRVHDVEPTRQLLDLLSSVHDAGLAQMSDVG